MSEAKPTSAAIAQRIRDERHRLMLEQNLAVDLDKQRLAPLEAGDDAALDRVELQIQGCNDRQLRIQERIEILERRREEAEAAERDDHLNTLTARAHEAREAGERLIRDAYLKQAKALAGTLAKLRDIDRDIEHANADLERAGRAPVPSPNAIRCLPAGYVEWTEHKRVGIGEPAHPMHGKVYWPSHLGSKVAYEIGTNKAVDTFVDVDIERRDFYQGDSPAPLYFAVKLPAIEPEQVPTGKGHQLHSADAPSPIWDARPSTIVHF